MKKKIKLGLLPKILIAILLGLILGTFSPLPVVRIFVTFSSLFAVFLNFCVPLIILSLIIPGIADLGKSAGRLLLLTVAIAYASTLFSGFFTFFSCKAIFPAILHVGDIVTTQAGSIVPTPFFTLTIPPLLDVMSALVLAFILGIGISYLKADRLKEASFEFKSIIEKLITAVIIPLLPFYIFSIFLNMAYTGTAFETIKVFGKVIGVIFVLHIILLIIQFTVAGIVSHSNPFKLLKTMLPAYFTALGTSSSAATIPVTLAQTKKNGVNEDIAGFCIPLCATIHLAGSTLKITGIAMAIMYMHGFEINTLAFAGFIAMLGIAMVAAPGVPGGAIMTAIGVLQSILGFGDADIALITAVYIAIDSFGTACNVTGDGAIAVIVNQILGYRLQKPNVEAIN